MLQPVNLRCEYLVNPLGIDVLRPRLGWCLESELRIQAQSAYQVLVAESLEQLQANEPTVWDSGEQRTDQTQHILYAGPDLRSGSRYWWKVRSWDMEGEPSQYSEPAWWEMGLLDASEWQAGWIWLDTGPATELNMKPCAYLRHTFQVAGPIQRARAYTTARGVYELSVNGQRVGDAVLTPGWTDYDHRIQVQTYDVTDLLRAGENVIGAILGDGWYHGHVGHKQGRAHYGTHPEFLCQLKIEYADGSTAVLGTDSNWKGSAGPILFSDLLMGETYDARREMPGWNTPEFDDSAWRDVQVDTDLKAQLVANRAPPIRVTQEIAAQTVTHHAQGTTIIDLGQNMVGWVRLQVQGEAGTTVRLRFGEMLNPDGSLHTDNLRSARATDTYILKGDGLELYEPRFTFHGFRYVEVSGYPGELSPDAITGRVIHSDLEETSVFECSNPMVNQLWRNILWGQRGNFVSVPTDCPQRDERLGWMGDAQIFARTACLNTDAAAFFTKWMIDVEDGQFPSGAFPDVAPRLVVTNEGSPAWGDAGIIVPWTVYQVYQDRQILERHYPAMARWMEYIHEANPHFLRTKRLNNNYGDWVSFDRHTSEEMLATAYWAHNALLMSEIADAIGRSDDVKKYRQLFEGIRAAFNTAYVHPDGRIEGGSQTGYVLALYMDLLPNDLNPAAAGYLVEAIQKRDWHLSTGFIGTAYICPVLTEHGHSDVAYRLLLNETCPSWGFMVKHGATTIWERWNSWTIEEGIHEPRMNSYNHYAFGAVGEWLYRHVAGIDTDPSQPGFQHIRIQPFPGGNFSYAKAEYRSIRGLIVSDWHSDGDAFRLSVTVPANTTATVFVPATGQSTVTESGEPPEAAAGVEFLRQGETERVFAVGSGKYTFVVTPNPFGSRRRTQ